MPGQRSRDSGFSQVTMNLPQKVRRAALGAAMFTTFSMPAWAADFYHHVFPGARSDCSINLTTEEPTAARIQALSKDGNVDSDTTNNHNARGR